MTKGYKIMTMKYFNWMTFLFLIFLLGCMPSAVKPKVSIAQYAKQVTEMNTVITKLMNETDPKVLHDMAFGVESTRVVLCDPVGEECNLYYQLINKMVYVTNDGNISEEDRALLTKMNNDLQNEIKRTEAIVIKEWEEYVSRHSEKDGVKK